MVDDEGGFEEVYGSYMDVESFRLGEEVYEGGKDGNMGIQFDLIGYVEDDEVFFCEGIESFGQLVEVFYEEFEVVDEVIIGFQIGFFYGIVE